MTGTENNGDNTMNINSNGCAVANLAQGAFAGWDEDSEDLVARSARTGGVVGSAVGSAVGRALPALVASGGFALAVFLPLILAFA
ncbi:MAG: hypothetical protein ABGY28_09960 [bacterium]